MEAKKVDIIDLSSFLLFYFIKNEIEINHLKLHKILYYIQAWHLVYFKKKNIFDELPEAWVNGPVYRKVYNKFKDFRIYDKLQLKKKYEDDIDDLYKKSKRKIDITKEQWNFLKALLLHYGTMTHERLVYLTHAEEPWNNARKGLEPFSYSNQVIAIDDMYNYYNKIKK